MDDAVGQAKQVLAAEGADYVALAYKHGADLARALIAAHERLEECLRVLAGLEGDWQWAGPTQDPTAYRHVERSLTIIVEKGDGQR